MISIVYNLSVSFTILKKLMSEKDIDPNKYSEFRSAYNYYIDSDNTLYRLKTENEEELNRIYKIIKTELIDSNKHSPQRILQNILDIILYNSRYTKSYLKLAERLYDEYHITEVNDIKDISNHNFYKEYEIQLNKYSDFDKFVSENTIYGAIMFNDIEKFISFTEREGFNEKQKLKSKLYPDSDKSYSLLELCCYHGSADCFKLLRTKFNSEITQTCLNLSFLGGNAEIMSECLKYQTPDSFCMEYAIISHNIDFVTFLMYEYNIKIDVESVSYTHLTLPTTERV